MVAKEVIKKFGLEEYQIERISQGHINDTFLVLKGDKPEFILQKINQKVFKEPVNVLFNYLAIQDHLEESAIFKYHIPELLNNYVINSESVWRLFRFEKDSNVILHTDDHVIASNAAKAFANFTLALSDLSASTIINTIPDFHEPLKRVFRLVDVVQHDPTKRLSGCKEIIDLVLDHEKIADEFEQVRATLPIRVVHNDTKLSNILFDNKNEVASIIDLDTVMPGYVIFDFGDMVRSMCNSAGEGSSSLDQVYFNHELYKVIQEGYIEGWEGEMTREELKSLSLGAKVIIYEQAVRFLTDYLDGDVYYKVDYPEENLVRAQVQLKLLEDMLRNK